MSWLSDTFGRDRTVIRLLYKIEEHNEERHDQIMAKLSTLQATLDALGTQLEKATSEIQAEIKNLQDQLGDVEIPAGAQTSLDKLSSLAQALDDLNPDVPPPTP